MAAEEIHVGDIGTIFEITLKDDAIAVDISSATVKEIVFKKPVTGAVVTKTADFTTDGVDGKIQYVTIADDLDVSGNWKIQAIVTLPSGKWSSDKSSFKVHTNLI